MGKQVRRTARANGTRIGGGDGRSATTLLRQMCGQLAAITQAIDLQNRILMTQTKSIMAGLQHMGVLGETPTAEDESAATRESKPGCGKGWIGELGGEWVCAPMFLCPECDPDLDTTTLCEVPTDA